MTQIVYPAKAVIVTSDGKNLEVFSPRVTIDQEVVYVHGAEGNQVIAEPPKGGPCKGCAEKADAVNKRIAELERQLAEQFVRIVALEGRRFPGFAERSHFPTSAPFSGWEPSNLPERQRVSPQDVTKAPGEFIPIQLPPKVIGEHDKVPHWLVP